MIVCLFAFLGLMAIWWHIGRRQQDAGQVWLALSILCWSFSGVVEILYAQQYAGHSDSIFREFEQTLLEDKETLTATDLESLLSESDQYIAAHSIKLDGWRSILSLFNSLFILLALPYFRYKPKRLAPIINSNYWNYIIGLPFLFSLLPTLSKLLSGQTNPLISELDVYYAVLTLVFLGFVLWESFEKRRLPFLAWLSLVSILITATAQLYKLTNSSIDLTLFSAIFKTTLIMIFFALALSWVKELAENIFPSPDFLFFTLIEQKNQHGQIVIKGLPGKDDRTISLTPALFSLLKRFAEEKTSSEQGWLEIKPKNEKRSARQYDIKDHNEVKRLLSAVLDGLFGKGNWTQNLHAIPLKDVLFEMSEKRERKIRLRIPPENITFQGPVA